MTFLTENRHCSQRVGGHSDSDLSCKSCPQIKTNPRRLSSCLVDQINASQVTWHDLKWSWRSWMPCKVYSLWFRGRKITPYWGVRDDIRSVCFELCRGASDIGRTQCFGQGHCRDLKLFFSFPNLCPKIPTIRICPSWLAVA